MLKLCFFFLKSLIVYYMVLLCCKFKKQEIKTMAAILEKYKIACKLFLVINCMIYLNL